MKHRRVVHALAWLSLAFAIQAYRFFAYLRVPQFWGEDGPVFYKQAYDSGWDTLFVTFDGYMHLYARLVSLATQWVPMQYAPMAFVVGSALAQAIAVGFVWSPRLPLTTLQRGLFTVAMATIPHAGEVPFNLTNAQWFLGMATVLLLVRTPPTTRRAWLGDCAWLVLFGFSGPFLVLFAPVVGVVLLVARRPLGRWGRALWAVAGLVGLAHVSQWHWAERAHRVATTTNTDADKWMHTLTNFVGPFFVAHVVPRMESQPVDWTEPLLVGTLTALSLWVIWPRRRQDPVWPLALSILACGMACYVAGLWENRDMPSRLHPYTDGQRSYFILYSAVAWLFILTLTAKELPRLRRGLAAIALVVSTGCTLWCANDVIRRADYHFAQQVQMFEARPQSMFINPPGWRYSLQHHPR